jgi:hypothetical protein
MREFTTASTDLTVAEHLYTAPNGGPTMVTGLWICSSQGGTSNQFRVHHLLPVGEETTASSNCIINSISSYRNTLDLIHRPIKLIMEPGERLYAQLHSGTAVSLSGMGLVPRNA